MKKKLALVLTAITLSMTLFVGCGSISNVSESNETVTEVSTFTTETTPEQAATSESTETTHVHAYVEIITTEATCEADGVKTFTCECGDTYTEPIATQGHVFETYTSNNDATYTADGTETAKCNNCEVTDTRTAEGSMLTYTYTDMDATMYAQKTVNVRSLPNTDGEKLGSLSTNDEVKVTGQCVETSWYRIEYSGGVAYVSDSYLGNDKVVMQTEAPKQTQSEMPTYTTYADVKAYAISLGYPIGSATDNGDGTCTTYSIQYITPNGSLSWDNDYEARSVDLDNARKQAASILGATSNDYRCDFGNYRNVTIANGENGYTWKVCREQYWLVN